MSNAITDAITLTCRSAVVERPDPLGDEVVALFDRYRDRLLRYVLSFGLQAQDGEELVQEVFMCLFQHLQLGKSRENLRGWLFRVAHNQALKQRYRNRRTSSVEDELTAARKADVDPDPSPEDRLVINQTQTKLRAVIAALPEKDRWCLSLRAEGMRYREIAATLDISLGAVSLSLTRSLARISRAADRAAER